MFERYGKMCLRSVPWSSYQPEALLLTEELLHDPASGVARRLSGRSKLTEC